MKTQLRFDSTLYLRPALEQAIADYHGIACIRYTEDDRSFVCQLESHEYPIELVCREFSNYVLALTVQQGAADALA